MSVWVKFHDALRKGAKRAIPKASRFVFLELCIEARPLLGEIDLRTDMEVGDAVHDLIGGNQEENNRAVADLLRAGMVRIDKTPNCTRLVIPSWEHWNKADESTERVKRWRDKKRAEQADPCVYFVQRVDGAIKIGFTDTFAIRIIDLRQEHGPLDVLAKVPGGRERELALHQTFRDLRIGRTEWFRAEGPLLEFISASSRNPDNVSPPVAETGRGEERRGEETRVEERAPATPAAPPAGPSGLVFEGLSLGADLFRGEDVGAAAKRIEAKLGFNRKADGLDRRQVGAECATYARSKLGQFPHALPARLLGFAEEKADYILRDVDLGKFKPAPSRAAGGSSHSGDFDAANAAREVEEADRKAAAAHRARGKGSESSLDDILGGNR